MAEAFKGGQREESPLVKSLREGLFDAGDIIPEALVT